jgi:two-component system, response regulator FlrC
VGPEAIMLTGGRGIPVSALQTTPSTPMAPSAAAKAAAGVTSALVGRTVAAVERDLIIDTLQHCLGNRTHAANILGISIRTLRNKLKQYNEEGVPVPGAHGESDHMPAA